MPIRYLDRAGPLADTAVVAHSSTRAGSRAGRPQGEAENALEHQEGVDGLVGVELAAAPSPVMVVVEPVVHDFGINPEGERATVDQRLIVLRPVGDGVKRRAHDADLKRMVMIRSPSPQLVPFKLRLFVKQRRH